MGSDEFLILAAKAESEQIPIFDPNPVWNIAGEASLAADHDFQDIQSTLIASLVVQVRMDH